MKIIVYHNYYGCETGCCGHIIKSDDPKDSIEFEFNHPSENESLLKFAQDWVREKYGDEHVKDLDWENCNVSRD